MARQLLRLGMDIGIFGIIKHIGLSRPGNSVTWWVGFKQYNYGEYGRDHSQLLGGYKMKKCGSFIKKWYPFLIVIGMILGPIVYHVVAVQAEIHNLVYSQELKIG